MVDFAVLGNRLRPVLRHLLTLVVTPSMLMIFTRSKNSRFYAFFRRLFRRGKGTVSSTDTPSPDAGDEPAIAFPKAAEINLSANSRRKGRPEQPGGLLHCALEQCPALRRSRNVRCGNFSCDHHHHHHRPDPCLIGAVPTWPHSRSWGYGPSGIVGVVLVVLLVLLLMGRL